VGLRIPKLIIEALKWQIEHADEVPLETSATSNVVSYAISNMRVYPELDTLSVELFNMYNGKYSVSMLRRYAIANYVRFNTDSLAFSRDDITVPSSIRLVLSNEIANWLKENYGNQTNGIRECINIGHSNGDLPPLGGLHRSITAGGKQVSCYLNTDTREKLTDMMLRHGGSYNNIIKQCIQVARSAGELF
jgi:hypothetical protein